MRRSPGDDEHPLEARGCVTASTTASLHRLARADAPEQQLGGVGERELATGSVSARHRVEIARTEMLDGERERDRAVLVLAVELGGVAVRSLA